jgi:hypothetical protein
MFVPSLSWQKDRFYIQMAQKKKPFHVQRKRHRKEGEVSVLQDKRVVLVDDAVVRLELRVLLDVKRLAGFALLSLLLFEPRAKPELEPRPDKLLKVSDNLRQTQSTFSTFSHVCPEPVSVKRLLLAFKVASTKKRQRFRARAARGRSSQASCGARQCRTCTQSVSGRLRFKSALPMSVPSLAWQKIVVIHINCSKRGVFRTAPRRTDHPGRNTPVRKTRVVAFFFECLPYICPEPVMVKRSICSVEMAQKRCVFRSSNYLQHALLGALGLHRQRRAEERRRLDEGDVPAPGNIYVPRL